MQISTNAPATSLEGHSIKSAAKQLPHVSNTAIEFSRQISDQETRLLGFGIGLKQVSTIKKVKDIWKSKAEYRIMTPKNTMFSQYFFRPSQVQILTCEEDNIRICIRQLLPSNPKSPNMLELSYPHHVLVDRGVLRQLGLLYYLDGRIPYRDKSNRFHDS